MSLSTSTLLEKGAPCNWEAINFVDMSLPYATELELDREELLLELDDREELELKELLDRLELDRDELDEPVSVGVSPAAT